MDNKKNLPNIPLYIGDWEKDCNVLSLETEAAWLRIIFKMFSAGKQSTYKIPTKGLQNLWRVPEDKVQNIIQELVDYNICDIVIEGRFTEFTCRRYVKENAISEVRRKAVSQRKDRKKSLQTTNKEDTNNILNTENENENDNVIDIDNKGGVGEKEKKKKFNFRNSMIEYGFKEDLVDEWLKVRKAKKAINTEKSFNKFISEVEKVDDDINLLLEIIAVQKQWRGFEAAWLATFTDSKNKTMYTYDEAARLVTDRKAEFKDFDKKEIDGTIYWIPKKKIMT